MQDRKSTFGVQELSSLLCSVEGYLLKMTMFKPSFLKSAVSISPFFLHLGFDPIRLDCRGQLLHT